MYCTVCVRVHYRLHYTKRVSQVRDQLPAGQHVRPAVHLRVAACARVPRERDARAVAVRRAPPAAARAAAVGQCGTRRRGRPRVQVRLYSASTHNLVI